MCCSIVVTFIDVSILRRRRAVVHQIAVRRSVAAPQQLAAFFVSRSTVAKEKNLKDQKASVNCLYLHRSLSAQRHLVNPPFHQKTFCQPPKIDMSRGCILVMCDPSMNEL
jgi:hypothetical protein